MKKTLLIMIFVLFCFGKTNAQDTITKLNGEKIIVKISEITPTEIRYKRLDLPDSPLYNESKTNVQSIKFSNGIEEKIDQKLIPALPTTAPPSSLRIEIVGNKFLYENTYINERALHKMLLQSKNSEIIKLVRGAKTAKGMQYIGFGAIPLGIGAFAFFIAGLVEGFTYDTADSRAESYFIVSAVCISGAITCPIVSGISKKNRTKYNRQAIRLYNTEHP